MPGQSGEGGNDYETMLSAFNVTVCDHIYSFAQHGRRQTRPFGMASLHTRIEQKNQRRRAH